MCFTTFFPTDTQGVRGKGGVDCTLQTRRGGSLQVQHGLPARGWKSLCSPQPNPHYLPCTAHSRAQRRRCPLAHLHASRWAHPQPRRGRHPPATWPAPHVREGWHQADGLHHRRPHRQADHHGLRGWQRRVFRHCCNWRGEELRAGKVRLKRINQTATCSLPSPTLHSPRTSSPFQTGYFSAQRDPFPCIFRLHLHVSRVVVWSVRSSFSLVLHTVICSRLPFCIDSCAFLKHFSPILTNKTSAQ